MLRLVWLEVERLPEASKLEEDGDAASSGTGRSLTTQVLRDYLKAKRFSLPFVVDGVCARGTEVSTHVEGRTPFQ